MIYHIAVQDEWHSQADLPTYAPNRYRKDGFIHCSEQQQLKRVADYNLLGMGYLVLLEIIPTKLNAETRYEQGRTENYPPIYGPINKGEITRTMAAGCNPDGRFSRVFDEL